MSSIWPLRSRRDPCIPSAANQVSPRSWPLLQRYMERSYDCPQCDEVAFVVVQPPDIVRCLSCGCEWQFAPPEPKATPRAPQSHPAIEPPQLPLTKEAIGRRYALVLAKYVARFHTVPPSILTEEAATELMLAALKRDTSIDAGEIAASTKQDPDKSG